MMRASALEPVLPRRISTDYLTATVFFSEQVECCLCANDTIMAPGRKKLVPMEVRQHLPRLLISREPRMPGQCRPPHQGATD
jgi:hypothetical protein